MAMKKFKFETQVETNKPKTIGEAADRLYELRQLVAEANKVAEAIKHVQSKLREEALALLAKQESKGGKGQVGQITKVTKTGYTLEDPSEFYAYIKRQKGTSGFDLLQRRPAVTAISARFEDGKKVPGVRRYQYVDLSVTKV